MILDTNAKDKVGFAAQTPDSRCKPSLLNNTELADQFRD
jgi:hypothetical protein